MKVATSSYSAKPYTPSNLYPVAAPPPSQVEVLEKTKPKPKPTPKNWKQQLQARRATRKTAEKRNKISQQLNSAKENLAIMQAELSA